MAPEEFKSMQEDTAGHFGGVGIEVELKEGELVVVSPIDDTPAARAGLLAGDRVVKIDGADVEGMDSTEAMRRIKGVPGTKVVLTIDRPEFETPREFVLIRERIRMNPVDHSMPLPGYGLVRVRVFSERTDRYLAEALQALHKAAGGPLKGLVLDLRNNPGGLLDQAVRVVDRFVEEGLIVETLGRSRRADKEFAHKQGTEPDYPMVCLVNGGSASASEIVAGALQDLDRALLVGSTTFGKGSVQRVFPLPDRKAALKLTTALYYTPSGRSIDRATRDSLPDEEDAADAPAPPSAPDSTPPPLFRTRAGRTVHGGGGITPDVIAGPDTLTGLPRRVESRNLAFRFANRWLNTHPQPQPDVTLPVPWTEFLDWLREEQVEFTAAEAASGRAVLERAVRREMARRMLGDGAATRVALEGDPAWARACAALAKARDPRDVFATAAPPAGKAAVKPVSPAHRAPVKPATRKAAVKSVAR
jgi:carboxyl-terminal processing protease